MANTSTPTFAKSRVSGKQPRDYSEARRDFEISHGPRHRRCCSFHPTQNCGDDSDRVYMGSLVWREGDLVDQLEVDVTLQEVTEALNVYVRR